MSILGRLADSVLNPGSRLGDRFICLLLKNSVRQQLRLKREEQLPIVRSARRRHSVLLLPEEVSQLIDTVQRVLKVDGDIAEVGVFDGGSARLIAEVKGSKSLHLFDTFSGFPDPSARDGKFFRKGQLTPRKSVRQMEQEFQAYDKVHIYPGIFPQETGHYIRDRRFAFVHLDVDLYESTLASLEFFYPRMNKGGVIISHDYLNMDSVRSAFDEFFKDRTEPVLFGMGSQCVVVKT